MKITLQLLKEFWLPLSVSLAWVLYNLPEISTSKWSLRDFVNLFGPTFFFASWLVAQWYRVGKQQKVEDGLIGIQSHIKQMLNELDAKSSDLVGHITGGDSFCYISGSLTSANQLDHIVLIHHGKHPLYNVHVRLVDLEALGQIDEKNMPFEKIQKVETHHKVQDVIPGHIAYIGGYISLGAGNTRRFNVFFTARNGSFSQQLRFKRINGSWVSATKVEKGEQKFEEVSDYYPRNESGQVEWDAA